MSFTSIGKVVRIVIFVHVQISYAVQSSSAGCHVKLEPGGGPKGVVETLKWRDGLTKTECVRKCEKENLEGAGCAAVIVDKDVG